MPRLIGAGFLMMLAVAALLATCGQALASHVQCGDVITEDTRLDSDLTDCPGDGIVIGADGITLDLHGHTVSGDGKSPASGTCDVGILNGSRQLGCLDAVDDGHDGVVVRGGAIRGFDLGLLFLRTRQGVARDLAASDNRFGGIDVVLSRGARIEGNRAFDNVFGIRLLESSNGSVTDNHTRHNIDSGIVLEEVDDSRAQENSASGNERGIDLAGGHRNRLARNRVADNRVQGIRVFDGVSDNVIADNVVSGSGFYGIQVNDGADRNTVTKNRVYRNYEAIEVANGTDNGIQANTVFDNQLGILLHDGERERVEGNRVFDNRGVGIGGGFRAVIKRNRVVHNLGTGIDGFGESQVTRNVVSDNGTIGVSSGGPHNLIERNVISGNEWGMWLDETFVHDNLVLDNVVSSNVQEGIYLLEHADQNLVRGNRVSRNGGSGILVGDAGDSRIEDNRVWRNRIGIEGHDAYGLTITGNTAEQNTLDGIFVQPFGPEEPTRGGHVVSRNLVRKNGDDGIDVENPETILTANTALENIDLGIEGVPGVTDGGGNRARGNGNPMQCLYVACARQKQAHH